MPAKRIFLSYRREDSAGEAGRLSDRLALELGADSIFMDVDGIPLGADFVKRLTAEVASCDVLIAVIGPKWLDIVDDEGNRRLDSSNDFVRVEIAAALARDIPVIPILLEGTRIPRAARLPSDLKDLAVREGLDIRHASFHNDVNRLVLQLRQMPSTVSDGIAPEGISFQSPYAQPHRFFASAAYQASPAPDVPGSAELRGPPREGGSSAWRRFSPKYLVGAGSAFALIALAVLALNWSCRWTALFGRSGCSIEPAYQNYSSAELGVMIVFPSNILTLDTTERHQRQLYLKDGGGKQVIKIFRSALPEQRDVRAARENEVAQLKQMNFSLTYIAPEKEKNWSNWYVLSGVDLGTEFYFRRWYCPDSVVSIEFTYDKSVSPLFDGIIAKMTQQMVMTNCA